MEKDFTAKRKLNDFLGFDRFTRIERSRFGWQIPINRREVNMRIPGLKRKLKIGEALSPTDLFIYASLVKEAPWLVKEPGDISSVYDKTYDKYIFFSSLEETSSFIGNVYNIVDLSRRYAFGHADVWARMDSVKYGWKDLFRNLWYINSGLFEQPEEGVEIGGFLPMEVSRTARDFIKSRIDVLMGNRYKPEFREECKEHDSAMTFTRMNIRKSLNYINTNSDERNFEIF